ncbi:transcriptional regulator [Diaphorobacter sp. HDW4A]|uniref:helix-turn-helix domain-containing protein n=1 Tax=Diaphorobacter sp. HDW4A TaxID=2714924 RepID=UPI00140D1883|nr:helix-turn-helix domain-containing protein [Diaphorobacter sp. HDW4A]QIL81762.1 transcriptional regulator [Diaphorobacter sp. HDW4A]
MHPEEIKAALRMKGVTLTALGESAGVSRSMVTHVIHGHAKSAHVMELISKTIGKPVAAIWKDKPVLRRKRPVAPAAVTRVGASA